MKIYENYVKKEFKEEIIDEVAVKEEPMNKKVNDKSNKM